MNAGEGWIRALGFEPYSATDTAPATLRFDFELLVREGAS
jgi:hypothetical protein